MKKKILSVLLASAMVASLAGCGGKEEAAPAPSEGGTQAQAPAEGGAEGEAEAPAAGEEEAVTAKLLVWGPAEDQSAESGNWLPTMCEQFAAEHPNWDITFE